MRKKVYDTLGGVAEDGKATGFYDIFMMFIIVISMVPLGFKTTNSVFLWIEYISVSVFVVDYILRWCTADLRLKKGVASFFIHPFTPMAIIDILSILPVITLLNNSLKMLRVFRLFKTFKVFRTFKFLRYSRSLLTITNVLKKQKRVLVTVASLAVVYVLISALVIYNVEPDSFNTFFDAIYWATISLTTVGYGDIYPVTTIGRVVTMLSSFVGVGVIALPSGVITASYLDELNKQSKEKNDEEK